MTKSLADRNLLIGILALQFGLVNRDQLVDAMSIWTSNRDEPLDFIFVRQGTINSEGQTKLQQILELHLQLHGNDAEQSLAALPAVGSVQQFLAPLNDGEIEATLAHAADQTPADNVFQTQTIAQAAPTEKRFRILRPHARGGLGEVFVALDQELNREVALKEIQRRHGDQLESRGRFMLEAQITGGLEHPGIVPVYSLGAHEDGRPYYAMRFIRGESLKTAIKKFFQRFDSKMVEADAAVATAIPAKPPTTAFDSVEFRQLLARFIDVCNAIAYAHTRGVLHRDIKPDNVMLGAFGETLVVDWGLAKVTGKADEALSSSLSLKSSLQQSGSSETVMGSALGTPGYMSPEQAAGRLDLCGPATDIYSLGSTLFHILTGRPPHVDNSDGELLQRIQRGEFSLPHEINSAIPAPLGAICLKAMSIDSKERYATALGLAADVEHWLADEPVSARADTWSDHLTRFGRMQLKDKYTAWGNLLLALIPVMLVPDVLITMVMQQHWSPNLIPVCQFTRLFAFVLTVGIFRGWNWKPANAAERQMWFVWGGYLAACWALGIGGRLQFGRNPELELRFYQPLSCLTALAFFALAPNLWGYCVVLAMAFLGATLLMAYDLNYAPMIFGTTWAIALAVVGGRLRYLGDTKTK